jgi:hypothetical protein
LQILTRYYSRSIFVAPAMAVIRSKTKIES